MPAWSLGLGILGRGLIFFALAALLFSAVAWILAPRKPRLEAWAKPAFYAGCWSLIAAFALLIGLILGERYEYRYVFGHSERSAELIFKIAAAWAGQEGSFLLWATSCSIFGLLATKHTGTYRRWFTATYGVFLAAIAAILSYESPFALMPIEGKLLVPPDGNGMVPTLMNAWIIIHPPTIFLGFGSLLVLFSWAVAALVSRDMESWAKPVRPWTILSITFLGFGLCLGGLWAYETLGWGGFWMWDPVENTSFVPWVLGVAFLHGLFVQIARGKWHYANALLAGLAQISFVYGTFLTRSGFLGDTSVHSFAEMDRSALWLLTSLMAVSFFGFMGLWGTRTIQAIRAAKTEPTKEGPKGWALEANFSTGIWTLMAMGAATAIGMSVPLIMSLSGRQPRVVEEQMYHHVLVWFYFPIVLAMAIGPFLTWRGLSAGALIKRMSGIAGMAFGFTGIAMIGLRFVPEAMLFEPDSVTETPFGPTLPLAGWVLTLLWFTMFAAIANAWRMFELWKRARPSLGGMFTHFGVLLLMIGLIASRGLQHKEQFFVQKDRPTQAMGYRVEFEGRADESRDYLDRNNRVNVRFTGYGESFVAQPTIYYTPPTGEGQEPQPNVRPWIFRRPFHDFYVALHPMVFEVADPLVFQVGEEKIVDQAAVVYQGIERVGEPGQVGTEFRAVLQISTPRGRFTAKPGMRITGSGPEFIQARVGDEYMITMSRMDAATQAATLDFFFVEPVFPIEVFYKPMTILVWIGTGIILVGGFWAAAYRRRTLRVSPAEKPVSLEERLPGAIEDAPPTTAQV